MDFSSRNPSTSNALNIAARNNEINTVRRLLKKINPNCVDNRGWTCLHEAAAYDSYQSLKLILRHPQCRPLSETHEGHTALYLAILYHSSMKLITALLKSTPDMANYGSTELVSPLHVASAQGRAEIVQLLLDYGAEIDVQDFDNDTPLHDAAASQQHTVVELLLHAGASAQMRNDSDLSPLQLACSLGCFHSVEHLYPFVTDVDEPTVHGDTPLLFAVQSCNDASVEFLLKKGANPNIINRDNETLLHVALHNGASRTVFTTLLGVVDKDLIPRDIIYLACKPHYFKWWVLEQIIMFGLGPEFYQFYKPFYLSLETFSNRKSVYHVNPPLNSYFSICEYIYKESPEKFAQYFYLFLMGGVSVNAEEIDECPPLVYIHYCPHTNCFSQIFKILMEQDCNVDHCSAMTCAHADNCIPDAFLASLTWDPNTVPIMIPYSLRCEPEELLKFAIKNNVIDRMSKTVQTAVLMMITDNAAEGVTVETLPMLVPTLKHLSRLRVRSAMRGGKFAVTTTKLFLDTLKELPLPTVVKAYLRYN